MIPSSAEFTNRRNAIPMEIPPIRPMLSSQSFHQEENPSKLPKNHNEERGKAMAKPTAIIAMVLSPSQFFNKVSATKNPTNWPTKRDKVGRVLAVLAQWILHCSDAYNSLL